MKQRLPRWGLVRVRVSRKKRNRAGWYLVFPNKETLWFKNKPKAIRMLRTALAAITFKIVPK